MANELIHASAGTTLTQAEFEAVGLHVCNNQATGDLIYASSASQLSRLPIVNSCVLVSSGGIPVWSSTLPAHTSGTITFNTASSMKRDVDSDALVLWGGSSAIDAGSGGQIGLQGKSHALAGQIILGTPNAAGNANVYRLTISGVVATAVATWTNITHTGIVLSGALLYGANQVVGARIVDATINDAIEAGFTVLYPNASAVLLALQTHIQTHGLITAA